MNSKLSKSIKEILAYSMEEAKRLGNEFVGTEHLFLGMLKKGNGNAIKKLTELGVNLDEIAKRLEFKIQSENKKNFFSKNKNIPLLKSTEKALKWIFLEAKSLKSKEVNTEHLLLAILKDNKSEATRLLNNKNINYDMMRKHLNKEITSKTDSQDKENKKDNSVKSKSKKKSTTPVLDAFGTDLNYLAEQKKLDPIVGRHTEIERLVQVLSRRKKNNPVLIGHPGVGKSAIVEGLATRIIEKKVSRVLFGKRIVSLDLASIVAGTKYRGQFEERMKSILNELENTDEVILFIDEIHTLVGAGGAAGSLDAANMLKPALARGEIQCIGATTLDEYRQQIEKDGALERRFQKIMVDPTTVKESIEILKNIKKYYEKHHNVFYTSEAINSCVFLSERYITDRNLPDKSIDVLDEVGSHIHIANIKVPLLIDEIEKDIERTRIKKMESVKEQNFEKAADLRDNEKKLLVKLEEEKINWEKKLEETKDKVFESDVENVVAMMTGIPVQKIARDEISSLVKMGDKIKERIIGQNEAVEKIVKAIRRSRVGLKDPNKPIGTFVFMGQTGVGKTQLAKVLADYLFEGKDSLIRMDMSEYMEKFSISRLIGSPPGYVGYGEGGQLTEKVRRKPYSVILLDEIEKAHPDVFNILLQVLDDGQLTDSLGNKVDFRNTILIMTSNVGTRETSNHSSGVGFATSSSVSLDKYNEEKIKKALKKTFAPEFLNRIDDIVSFNSLDKKDIFKIMDIELIGLFERVNKLNYQLEISQEAKNYVVEKGFEKKFGARPIKRAIQRYFEDEISEKIISTNIKENDIIKVDFDKENKKIEVGILIKKIKKNAKK